MGYSHAQQPCGTEVSKFDNEQVQQQLEEWSVPVFFFVFSESAIRGLLKAMLEGRGDFID